MQGRQQQQRHQQEQRHQQTEKTTAEEKINNRKTPRTARTHAKVEFYATGGTRQEQQMGPQKIFGHRDTMTTNNRKASQTARVASKSRVVSNSKDAIATALMPMMTDANGRDVSNIKDACNCNIMWKTIVAFP
jgi:hypothetical protein